MAAPWLRPCTGAPARPNRVKFLSAMRSRSMARTWPTVPSPERLDGASSGRPSRAASAPSRSPALALAIAVDRASMCSGAIAPVSPRSPERPEPPAPPEPPERLPERPERPERLPEPPGRASGASGRSGASSGTSGASAASTGASTGSSAPATASPASTMPSPSWSRGGSGTSSGSRRSASTGSGEASSGRSGRSAPTEAFSDSTSDRSSSTASREGSSDAPSSPWPRLSPAAGRRRAGRVRTFPPRAFLAASSSASVRVLRGTRASGTPDASICSFIRSAACRCVSRRDRFTAPSFAAAFTPPLASTHASCSSLNCCFASSYASSTSARRWARTSGLLPPTVGSRSNRASLSSVSTRSRAASSSCMRSNLGLASVSRAWARAFSWSDRAST